MLTSCWQPRPLPGESRPMVLYEGKPVIAATLRTLSRCAWCPHEPRPLLALHASCALGVNNALLLVFPPSVLRRVQQLPLRAHAPGRRRGHECRHATESGGPLPAIPALDCLRYATRIPASLHLVYANTA